MFTGIVEALAPVAWAEEGGGALSLGLDLGPLAEGVQVGDSIAVAGCCLTVARREGTRVGFHLMGETLSHGTFDRWRVGDTVNVERSLRVGDRLGGHFVSGHLDGLGTVVRRADLPGQTDLSVSLPEALRPLVIHKGSIAIDGVSLTVAQIESGEVTVCLIPHTLQVTSLGRLRVGDRVHLEMDQLGKWVRALLPPSAD